ncbi:MAG: 3-dehydroquinate synthase [Betaproteobacteria bacterium AqS2]|uniref:3-dehydroquinate synthase n=1 Tax=Candidatus Amphirhobacter heronislandensis TaxID=1732024 RepID=A0A930UBX2_9GAMM|nr:3-dehydroquinate synthase [Betaproteobacteria bacterium AqS2]
MSVRKVSVAAAGGSYDVVIGAGVLEALAAVPLAEGERAAVIADAGAWAKHGAAVLAACKQAHGREPPVFEVPAGEASKSWEQLERACAFLAEQRIARQDLLIACGGGMATDLGGFAAAAWMRGIRHVAIPTTLLAQVDAAVGGKTGINIAAGKNLVGSFHQPRLVIADVALLTTLPPREFSAGLAECVKHAVLDAGLYAHTREHSDEIAKGVDADPAVLAELVERNVAFKAAVVAADEREGGRRMLLNLGHTFAHALETVTGYGRYLHGEAVSLGLLAACRLAARLGLLTQDKLADELAELLQKFSLPVSWPEIDPEELLKTMSLDKKVAEGKLRFVLPEAAGEVSVVPGVDPAEVRATLKELA